jgi:hypothetical protein
MDSISNILVAMTFFTKLDFDSCVIHCFFPYVYVEDHPSRCCVDGMSYPRVTKINNFCKSMLLRDIWLMLILFLETSSWILDTSIMPSKKVK